METTGDVSVLNYREVAIPSVGDDQVLVRIHAAGINFVDVYTRNGLYPSKSNILGKEGAGIVHQVGNDVKNFVQGDRVVFFSNACSGAYAQFAAVPAKDVIKIPDDMDFSVAASLPCQGMTAHYLAYSTHPLKNGEIALIHAGAGGTGRLLIAIAKKLGATVIATVSSKEKAEIAKSAGADHVINYTETKFEEQVGQITGGTGVHVVYDSVGKSTWEFSLACLRKRGHLVLFGNASGPVPPIDPLRLTRAGSITLTRPSLADYLLDREELEWRMNDLIDLYRSGKLPVSICAQFPLKDVASAHNFLEGRGSTGKIILTC